MNQYKLYSKIYEIYQKCNIKSMPVNCFSVLDLYGFKLYTYKELKSINPELYIAAKRYSDDAFQFKNSIFFNDDTVPGRISFSLMHELGHYVLGHTTQSNENEAEADYFASCVLAPRILIHYLDITKTADEIHNLFGLSYAASNNALIDYNHWIKNFLSSNSKEVELKLYDMFSAQKNLKVHDKNCQKYSVPKRIRKQREIVEHEKRRQFLLNYIYEHDDFRLAEAMRSWNEGC